MNAAILIRDEARADAVAVHEVHRRAFGGEDEAALVDRLRASCPDALSLVAEIDSRIVGHVLFTPVELVSPASGIRGSGLAPIGVLPEFQRRGIGARLIEEGLQILRQRQIPFVVVLGDPAYYSRFGFERAGRFHIGCEFDGVPDEAFMAIVWNHEALGGVSGVARYRPEFRAVA